MKTKLCSRPDCRLAGIPQSTQVFCIDKTRLDELHPYCRECRSKLASKRMENNPIVKEKARQATARYYKTKAGREKRRLYYIEHKSEFRARERKNQSRPDVLLKKAKKQALYRERNILKEAARRCIHYAIKAGEVIRPQNCEWCGKPANGEVLQAHHWQGYEFQNWFNAKFVHHDCHFRCEGATPEHWYS